MLNANSPCVQAMLDRLPSNIPMYDGPAPSIGTGFVPLIDPKDMVMQAGQDQYYQQQPMYDPQQFRQQLAMFNSPANTMDGLYDDDTQQMIYPQQMYGYNPYQQQQMYPQQPMYGYDPYQMQMMQQQPMYGYNPYQQQQYYPQQPMYGYDPYQQQPMYGYDPYQMQMMQQQQMYGGYPQQQPMYGYDPYQQQQIHVYNPPQQAYNNDPAQQYVGGINPNNLPTVQFNGALAPQNDGIPLSVKNSYNKAVRDAFEGYRNPYLGIGKYGGAPKAPPSDLNRYMGGNLYGYSGPELRQLIIEAQYNGITIEEQVHNQINLWKLLFRCAYHGHSEEEIERVCSQFDMKYVKPPAPPEKREHPQLKALREKGMVVEFHKGDEVLVSVNTKDIKNIEQYEINSRHVQAAFAMDEQRRYNDIMQHNMMYDRAYERQFDNREMIDYFNEAAPMLDYFDKKRADKKAMGDLIREGFDPDEFWYRVRTRNGIKEIRKANEYYDRISKEHPTYDPITDKDYIRILLACEVHPSAIKDALPDIKSMFEEPDRIEDVELYGVKIPRDEFGLPLPALTVRDVYNYNFSNSTDNMVPDRVDKDGTPHYNPAFTQNPYTGEVTINVPQFIDSRIEREREAFRRTIIENARSVDPNANITFN